MRQLYHQITGEFSAASRGCCAEFVWMAVMGPDTPALGEREKVEVTQSQVAATIAALLGEDFTTTTPKAAAPLPVFGKKK